MGRNPWTSLIKDKTRNLCFFPRSSGKWEHMSRHQRGSGMWQLASGARRVHCPRRLGWSRAHDQCGRWKQAICRRNWPAHTAGHHYIRVRVGLLSKVEVAESLLCGHNIASSPSCPEARQIGGSTDHYLHLFSTQTPWITRL